MGLKGITVGGGGGVFIYTSAYSTNRFLSSKCKVSWHRSSSTFLSGHNVESWKADVGRWAQQGEQDTGEERGAAAAHTLSSLCEE